MGISSSLFIGRSALFAYQSALQVVGQNIANVATPGYTRLSPNLQAIPGVPNTQGQIGNGVRLESVRRNVSEALLTRLRTAGSDQQSASSTRTGLTQIEGILDPLGTQNLGTLMSRFFNSVGELQNTPESLAARGAVINTGLALADKIRAQRLQLIDYRTELNRDLEVIAGEADGIATRIAALNVQIVAAEAGSNGSASGLRDQRDQLLAQLSEYFAITVREQSNGAVSVYIGNESLVQYAQSRGLKAVSEPGPDGLMDTVIRFKEDNGPVPTWSGRVDGIAQARDVHIAGLLSQIDTLATTLIQEVNRVHTGGQGLIGYDGVTSLNELTDTTVALNTPDNGLTMMPKTGSFFIDVRDSVTGTVQRFQIHIDLDGIGADSSLDSVAADINANTPLTATVTTDGRLTLSAPAGTSFSFADDTSGFLAATCVNAFFTGNDSSDINVNAAIVDDPRLVAASQSGLPGDGSNATIWAQIQNNAMSGLGGTSLNAYYTATVGDVAVNSSSAQATLDAAGVIFDTLNVQRESISGVNLDEEAVNMIKFQRSYEGAARYMNVVDSMLQTLLSLIR